VNGVYASGSTVYAAHLRRGEQRHGDQRNRCGHRVDGVHRGGRSRQVGRETSGPSGFPEKAPRRHHVVRPGQPRGPVPYGTSGGTIRQWRWTRRRSTCRVT
jgi:hypothetical protein